MSKTAKNLELPIDRCYRFADSLEKVRTVLLDMASTSPAERGIELAKLSAALQITANLMERTAEHMDAVYDEWKHDLALDRDYKDIEYRA